MAAPAYDMEAMIADIKRRGSIPTSQLTYTDADFTKICNNELKDTVVPLLMSCREDYFVDYIDVSVPSDGVIPFPSNTVASKVRNICYVQQSSPLALVNLPRIDLDIVAGVGYAANQTLSGFYIQGNDFVLYPINSVPVNTTLRIYYYKRTLVLAAPLEYGRVTVVDHGTGTITLDYVPTSWAIGTELNTISQLSGFGVENTSAITSLSSPTIIVDDSTGIEVGDFVSETGYSAIPQVPIEAHGWLAQLSTAKCLEGLGDGAGEERAMRKADRMKDSLMVMISQRVDGSVKKIMNASGGLRVGAGIRRNRGGW